ncbi:SecY-interacting protein [Catenovulum sediminis]|uniref:SecY-interacting protein n=1 Tax=Catenovulum sediminis TaxID=1740262 RepID=A0ABV1RE37_9ALTE|nr:SecY-interacting protein [Catenovulum sediminis]
MSDSIRHALQTFFSKAQDSQQAQVYYEADWLSPCIQNKQSDDSCQWKAIERTDDSQLKNIEQALQISLNPDVVDFYTAFYAPSLTAEFESNQLVLLQVWNDDDFKILQENIIGHLLMKKKLKQQATVFIASTDDDEYLISVVNQTGAVMLERVGQEPCRKLADSLAEFISALSIK